MANVMNMMNASGDSVAHSFAPIVTNPYISASNLPSSLPSSQPSSQSSSLSVNPPPNFPATVSTHAPRHVLSSVPATFERILPVTDQRNTPVNVTSNASPDLPEYISANVLRNLPASASANMVTGSPANGSITQRNLHSIVALNMERNLNSGSPETGTRNIPSGVPVCHPRNLSANVHAILPANIQRNTPPDMPPNVPCSDSISDPTASAPGSIQRNLSANILPSEGRNFSANAPLHIQRNANGKVTDMKEGVESLQLPAPGTSPVATPVSVLRHFTSEESNEVTTQPTYAPVVPSPDYNATSVSNTAVSAEAEHGDQSPTPGPSNSDIDPDQEDMSRSENEAQFDITSLMNLKKEIIYDDDDDDDDDADDADDTEVEDNLSDDSPLTEEPSVVLIADGEAEETKPLVETKADPDAPVGRTSGRVRARPFIFDPTVYDELVYFASTAGPDGAKKRKEKKRKKQPTKFSGDESIDSTLEWLFASDEDEADDKKRGRPRSRKKKVALRRVGRPGFVDDHPEIIDTIRKFLEENTTFAVRNPNDNVMYSSGVSLRQIAEHVQQKHQIQLSRSTIHRVLEPPRKGTIASKRYKGLVPTRLLAKKGGGSKKSSGVKREPQQQQQQQQQLHQHQQQQHQQQHQQHQQMAMPPHNQGPYSLWPTITSNMHHHQQLHHHHQQHPGMPNLHNLHQYAGGHLPTSQPTSLPLPMPGVPSLMPNSASGAVPSQPGPGLTSGLASGLAPGLTPGLTSGITAGLTTGLPVQAVPPGPAGPLGPSEPSGSHMPSGSSGQAGVSNIQGQSSMSVAGPSSSGHSAQAVVPDDGTTIIVPPAEPTDNPTEKKDPGASAAADATPGATEVLKKQPRGLKMSKLTDLKRKKALELKRKMMKQKKWQGVDKAKIAEAIKKRLESKRKPRKKKKKEKKPKAEGEESEEESTDDENKNKRRVGRPSFVEERPEIVNTIRSFLEENSSNQRKDDQPYHSAVSLRQVVEHVQAKHQIKLSRSTIHRVLEPPRKGTIASKRYKCLISARLPPKKGAGSKKKVNRKPTSLNPIETKFNPNASAHASPHPSLHPHPKADSYYPKLPPPPPTHSIPPDSTPTFPNMSGHFPPFPDASRHSPTFPDISRQLQHFPPANPRHHFPTFPNISQHIPSTPTFSGYQTPTFPNNSDLFRHAQSGYPPQHNTTQRQLYSFSNVR